MNIQRMTPPWLALSRRIRKTPFEDRVFEQGVSAFTTYNHMPLASRFASMEEDYRHLCEHVQVWDVACERQVEVRGPDALRLIEYSTPRDISRCAKGQCMYAPLVDENGGIVNDPVILRLAEDRFWVSLADSGALLWYKGLATGKGWDVQVFEPDVSPLAVQGPKADDLMADVLDDSVRKLKFFWFREVRIADTDVILARSGWSGQGGFEIYLQDSSKGLDLWDLIWEAGQPYQIRAGCPNHIDRVESGLLSYGSDMTLADNPYECGLERFVDADKEAECLCADALTRIRDQGSKKYPARLLVSGDELAPPRDAWDVCNESGERVGTVTSLVYSPKFKSNLAFATLNADACISDKQLRVDIDGKEMRDARVANRSWRAA